MLEFNILSELEHTQKKRLGSLGLFSLGRRRLLGEILLLSTSTCWEGIEKAVSLFSEMHKERANEQKLQHRMFW